jgi:toxin YoeB
LALPTRGDRHATPSSPRRRDVILQPEFRILQPEFRDDLRHWVQTDRRIALRLLELIEAIVRDPFVGIGKPEPLRHLDANLWSRRLTQEHRVVYMVRDDRIDFVQARYHY